MTSPLKKKISSTKQRVIRPGVCISHILIRFYQLTFSAIFGRHCRHLPSCSAYTDEAINRFGFWPGGWMGLARICRCHPLGTQGLDLVPDALPKGQRWYMPWRYGRWRGTYAPPWQDDTIICEAVEPDGNSDATPSS